MTFLYEVLIGEVQMYESMWICYHQGIVSPLVTGGGDVLHVLREAAKIFNDSQGQSTRIVLRAGYWASI